MKTNIFILLPLLIACSSNHFKNKNLISGIKVSSSIPVFNNKGKQLKFDTSSSSVYFYNNQILYHSYYIQDCSINGVSILNEKRDYFFVYTQNEKYGYIFNKYKTINKERVSVDSAKSIEFINSIKFESLLVDNCKNYQFISKSIDPFTDNMVVLCTFKGLEDSTKKIKGQLEYSNQFSNIPFTMSKKFDSLSQMKNGKLKKIKIITDLVQNGVIFPNFEISYFFEEETISDSTKQNLIYYFKNAHD